MKEALKYVHSLIFSTQKNSLEVFFLSHVQFFQRHLLCVVKTETNKRIFTYKHQN